MNGSYRTADGKAQIEWSLEDKAAGPEFSASGSFQGSVGQCLEEIAAAYPDDHQLQRIVAVWRLYHLNGMKTGLPAQEAAISAWIAAGNRYGTRWIYSPIPAEVLDEIKSWQGLPAHAPLHEDQAEEFLRSNGLTLRCTLSDSKTPAWNDDHAGHHYRVTISRARAGRLTFDFWDSVANADAGRSPTAYDVLAAISSDAYTPDTFADFCSEYGYDSDSITAKQTFTRASRFAARLRAFFSADELEQLSAIQ